MTYVTPEDLPTINKCLSEGNDVQIQRTKDGYRIVSQKVHVLAKKATSEKQN